MEHCLSKEQPTAQEAARNEHHDIGWACIQGDLARLERLIPPNARIPQEPLDDFDGMYPLHFASCHGHKHLVQYLLLEHDGGGANANCSDKKGWTPLHLAVVSQSTERIQVAELLLSHHANVNSTGHDGFSPLHLASEQFVRDSVQWLIEHGANLRLQDDNGRTPLQVAQDSFALMRDWSYLNDTDSSYLKQEFMGKEGEARQVIEYLQALREQPPSESATANTEQYSQKTNPKKKSFS